MTLNNTIKCRTITVPSMHPQLVLCAPCTSMYLIFYHHFQVSLGFLLAWGRALYQICQLSIAISKIVITSLGSGSGWLHEGKLVRFTALTFAAKELMSQGLRAEFDHEGLALSYRT